MLKEKLLEDLKQAMKEKNEVKKNTVQMVRTGILQVEKDNNITLEDDRILEIIAKEVKKRKDTLTDFEKGERDDLITQAKEEIQILTAYLPQQLTIQEITEVVKKVIQETEASSIKDMGNVMKVAKQKIGATADGKTIHNIVKELLT